MNPPSLYVGRILKTKAVALYEDGRGLSQREIADRAGVTRERMGQVLSKAGAAVPRGRKNPKHRP